MAETFSRANHFSLVYQKAILNGEVISEGPILAAEFTNQNEAVRAVRFTDNEDSNHYFTPEGDSLRPWIFCAHPVRSTRITSGFSKRRFHPIKKKWRAHKGVDYGAPRGTPILASGDGVVQFSGGKNAYGKTVILRHGGTYTTLYAHMKGFARGIRAGKRVQQGDVIGYVRQHWVGERAAPPL